MIYVLNNNISDIATLFSGCGELIINDILADTNVGLINESHPPIQYYKDNITNYNINININSYNNSNINPKSPKEPNKILEFIKHIFKLIFIFIKSHLVSNDDDSSHDYEFNLQLV